MHRPTPLIRYLTAGFASWLSLAPTHVQALTLGDMVVRSHLGQPLRAQIAVKTAAEESIDESCINLSRPTGTAEDLPYLSKARLTIEYKAGGQIIQIRSSQLMNEPVFKVFLQVTCGGQTSLSREFTLLLDPAGYASTVPFVEDEPPPAKPLEDKRAPTPGSVWEIRPGDSLASLARAAYPGRPAKQRRLERAIVAANPQLFKDAGVSAELPVGESLQIPTLAAARRTPTSGEPLAEVAPAPSSDAFSKNKKRTRRAVTQAATPEVFQLKLSTGDIDLSVSRNMTEEDRLKLREKQLLLEADDQVANILTLKNRVKELETRLAELSLKMSAGMNHASPAKPVMPAQRAALPARQAGPWSASMNYLWLGLGGLATLLGLFFVVRRQRQRNESLERFQIYDETFDSDEPVQAEPVRYKPIEENMKPGNGKPQTEEAFYDPSSIFTPPQEEITITEAETVIEEADLYLIYGWTQKAIELLQSHIEKHPQEIQPWMMLLDIYRTQDMKEAFDKLARRFKATFDNAEQWHRVQSLGRSLDPKNSLYLTEAQAASAGEAQPESSANAVPPEEKTAPLIDEPLDFWASSGSDFPPNTANRNQAKKPGQPGSGATELPRILDFDRKEKREK